MNICVCGHPHHIHAGGSVCQTLPCGCRGFRLDRVVEPPEHAAAITLAPTSRRNMARTRS